MAATIRTLPTGPLGVTAAVRLAEKARPIVPGYELVEPIGRGGMGIVFRAREKATGREVAIKWLTSRAEESLRLRFEREARAVCSVRHPNIVSVLAAGSTSEGSYLAMELVQGFSLGAALEANALGQNSLADVVAKVARALDAAHRSGVVHRDVKPDNIIVDEAGEPRLLDFGLARFLHEQGALTAENSVLGTLGYMAPEVFAGGGATAGPPCDVYALGAILYEGLAGTPPFGRGKQSEVLARMDAGTIDPLPESFPEPLRALAMAALDRDPAKRPTAGEMAVALDQLSAPLAKAIPGKPASALRFVAVGLLGVAVGGLVATVAFMGDSHRDVAATPVAAREPVAPPVEAIPAMDPAPETDTLPGPVSAPVESSTHPMAEAPSDSPTPVAVPEPEPAPVVAAPPLPPPPPPAPEPPRPTAKPDTLTSAQLKDIADQIRAALASNSRARADELARNAIAHAPSGVDTFVAACHATLGRDALVDLRTAQAEREYLKALVLDSKNEHALLGLVAVGLLEGSGDTVKKHLHDLEALGSSSPSYQAAKLLVNVARGVDGSRPQLWKAQSLGSDTLLVRTVGRELVSREQSRRR